MDWDTITDVLGVAISVLIPLIGVISFMGRQLAHQFERHLNMRFSSTELQLNTRLDMLANSIDIRFSEAERRRQMASDGWRTMWTQLSDKAEKQSGLVRELHGMVTQHYTPHREFEEFRRDIQERLTELRSQGSG